MSKDIALDFTEDSEFIIRLHQFSLKKNNLNDVFNISRDQEMKISIISRDQDENLQHSLGIMMKISSIPSGSGCKSPASRGIRTKKPSIPLEPGCKSPASRGISISSISRDQDKNFQHLVGSGSKCNKDLHHISTRKKTLNNYTKMFIKKFEYVILLTKNSNVPNVFQIHMNFTTQRRDDSLYQPSVGTTHFTNPVSGQLVLHPPSLRMTQ